jgi:hypothetical protein
MVVVALRIRDIVEKKLLDGVRLAAGAAGYENPVSWVNIMEILDTPESLQKGELLVTTGYHLNEETRYAGLMETLSHRDISGIAIQTGYYLREIPGWLLRQADRYGIPVLLLPEELTFSAISRTLIARIQAAPDPTPDRGIVQLEQQLAAELHSGFVFGTDHPAWVLVAVPSGDDMHAPSAVQEGLTRIRSYLLSQAQDLHQVSLPDGRAVFCFTLPGGTPNSDVVFELTILLTFLSEQQHINYYVGEQSVLCLGALSEAFGDAARCCDTLQRIGAKRGVCDAKNLPFFELFRSISRNSRESMLGKHSILHDLLDYDRVHGTNYVHTLRVYLAHGGAQSAAAARLFIHRHTLCARIDKIRALCGWDLSDYYTRTYLSVALILHDYFAF